ncbi:hypothetical protein KFL_001200220 [Klebsormidium nitens]|uniref:Crossover junction endonuclease MUS81 n=1 Tax=Klebsormidium nitens TaxID=105231 RepID=A0A1Y1I3L5_KLENI|nr:hypothetical protein KFL_001200220 [Klebsormidium nitens]|eukprot:GAQ82698.1 hypothetical protein KFL_001200220 [Klebsormidium nitens]
MAPAPRDERLIRALQARAALASAQNNIRKSASYQKAVEKLTAHRRPITSAMEIGMVKGIGVQIKKLLEKVYNGDVEEIPPEAEEAMEYGDLPIPQGFAYIPGPNTGARAILIAMFGETKRPGYPGFLMKDQIQAAATATGISNTSMYPQPNVGRFYSGWDGIRTLEENGLVLRTKHGMGVKEQFRLTDQGRQLAYFLEGELGLQQGGRQDGGVALPQDFSPAHRRLSGHCQGRQAGEGGFPEVMIGRGREIEMGSNLQQVEEVEAATGEGFRLYKAVCKSSSAVRKKYAVQLHVRVTLARDAEVEQAEALGRVFAGRRPELVARLKEMGFSEDRVLAALAATGADEAAAVQMLVDGASMQRDESGTAAPGGVTQMVVVRSECACPEGRSSHGKCKHAAALFLRVDAHLRSGAELDRPEPGKKKTPRKKRENGDGGLQAKTAPKRRKSGGGAEAPLPREEDRSLGAIAAQLAKSVGSPITPPKHKDVARTPVGASPREMAAQAAFERAAMQASLRKDSPTRAPPVEKGTGQRNVDFVDLEGGLGRAHERHESDQGVRRAVSANKESRSETWKGKEAARDALHGSMLNLGRATPGKGKAVAFVDLDSDCDDPPGQRDADSEEDAALLSVDWKSPRASWGSGWSSAATPASDHREKSGGRRGEEAGRGRSLDLDWLTGDNAPDPAELDRLVDTVTATAEPGSAPSASGRKQGGEVGGVRRVTVVVDETERQTNSNPNSVYLELHRQHEALHAVAGVALAAEKHKLETGDYLWLAETDEGSFVLDTVIERKTMSDLVTRSVTNAHLKQIQKMRASGLPHVCLLLEGEFRTARKFVAVAGQDCRGDVDSAEAVWQLMAELLIGTAKGMDVPQGVPIGSGYGPPPPVRVLQTKDVKGTCKLLTHISAALAARVGGGLEGGEAASAAASRQISLEDFNKEARQRRTKMNKLLKEAEGRAIESRVGDDGLEDPGERRGFADEVQRLSADPDAGVGPSAAQARSGVADASAQGGQPCDECEAQRAALECAECEQALCSDCCASLHSGGARRAHRLTSLPPPWQCEECEGASAAVSCGECEQALCASCSAKIHSKGARARHAVAPLSLAPMQPTSRVSTPPDTHDSVERSGRALMVASSSVYASLRTVDLGPRVALEQTRGERDRGPVEESLYLGLADPGGAAGRAGEREAFWVVLVKGDAFLRGMIQSQVAVSGASSATCPEPDLQAAAVLFLTSLPDPPCPSAHSPGKILILENVLHHCRAMAAAAERARLNGAAGPGEDGDQELRAFLGCHDLNEEMIRWIVRIMFSRGWNVQFTGNQLESSLLFRHLAKAYVK